MTAATAAIEPSSAGAVLTAGKLATAGQPSPAHERFHPRMRFRSDD